MVQRTDIGRIKDLLNSQFRKYARQFTREIGREIEQAYEDTRAEFLDVWVQWKNAKGEEAEMSRFLLQASDAYWVLGNGNEIKVDTTNDILTSGINVDPKHIQTPVFSRWGSRRNKKYNKKAVFEMMYYHGIMGYNKAIVDKSWYRSKESQRKYYDRYHLEGRISRKKILQNIKDADIIPPTAFKKPYKQMEKRLREIKSTKHLDAKWKEVSSQLTDDIERLVNSK